jgi:hypothetical protein
MSRQSAFVVLASVASLAAAAVWAEPGQVAGTGPFAVSVSGPTAILLDTATGRTWRLSEAHESSEPAWVPVTRIDDEVEAEKWRAEARERVADERRAAMLKEVADKLAPTHPKVLELRRQLEVEDDSE